VGKAEGKGLFGRHMLWCEDNIKIILKVWWVDCINLADAVVGYFECYSKLQSSVDFWKFTDILKLELTSHEG
jgi:hypothetical protein